MPQMERVNLPAAPRESAPPRTGRRLLSRYEPGDVLAFLYALVLVREAFWLLPNGVAWALSAAVAGALALVRLRSRPLAEPLPRAFWLGVALPVGFFWALHVTYPDIGYDVLNYHLLHGERALRGLLAIPGDFYPYYFPFLNPAPDVIGALLRHLLGYRLGTVGSGLVLLWTGAILWRALAGVIESARLRVTAVLCVLATEGILWEVGNYMADLWALPLLLEATLLALPREEDRDPLADLPAMGLLLGVAVALKLTNLPFAATIGVAYLARVAFARAAWSGVRTAVRGALAGALFVLPLVPHTLLVWWTTGSPLFPLYNRIFRSPLFPPIDVLDSRWGPKGLLETLAWPVLSVLHPGRASEMPVTSGRVALASVATLVALAASPRDRKLRTLALLLIASAILWSAGSGYVRYGLFVDLLGGLVLVFVVLRGVAATEGKGHLLRALALVPAAVVAAQSLFALKLANRGDWSGRPLGFRADRFVAHDLSQIGRDRDLARCLPANARADLDATAGWVDAAQKTNGIMALLAPERPMIGLLMRPVFDVRRNQERFDEALRAVRGRNLLSLAFVEDAASARSELAIRGFRVVREDAFTLPFFSDFKTLDMVALVVAAPAPGTPGPPLTARQTLLRRPGPPASGWQEFEGLLGSVDDPAEGATVHGSLKVRGWARRPGEDLELAFEIDGRPRAPREFRRAPRPDVAAVFPEMGDTSSAGYEAYFDFTPADAGKHELVAVFRTRDGRFRRFPPRRFAWVP